MSLQEPVLINHVLQILLHVFYLFPDKTGQILHIGISLSSQCLYVFGKSPGTQVLLRSFDGHKQHSRKQRRHNEHQHHCRTIKKNDRPNKKDQRPEPKERDAAPAQDHHDDSRCRLIAHRCKQL